MPSWSRRRALHAFAAAVALGLAGCTGDEDPPTTSGSPTRSRTRSPTGPSTSPPDGASSPTSGDDRPTATPRDPRPLASSGAWPQFGSEASHDGASSDGGVPDAAEPYWQLRRVRSGPAVLAGGRLFHFARLGEDPQRTPTVTRTRGPTEDLAHPVYGSPHLVARDASEGRIEWSAPLEDRGDGWPAAADGQVVAAAGGQLAAFDAGDGQRTWARELGGLSAGNPTVAEGTVVLPVQGGLDRSTGERHNPEVRAYGLARGDDRWQAELTGHVHDAAVAGDTVVAAAGREDRSGAVLALSLTDGSRRWRTETPGEAFRAPVVTGGTVYLASDDAGDGGSVRALALADGAERWHRPVDVGLAGVAADAGSVYVAAGETLSGLSAADGNVRWAADSAGADEFFVAPPAVSETVVYAGTIGDTAHIYALDGADGRQRWSHRFPDTIVEGDIVTSGVERQPVLADGAVYVHAADGLYALGPAD